MRKGLLDNLSIGLIALAILAELIALVRPLPALQPASQPKFYLPAQAVSLPWSAGGQSALGAKGYGILATSGTQIPAPTASVAKIITAMAVLKQKPLAPGDQGPTLTLGPSDVDNYRAAIGEDGSVVAVADGEQLSERQALEAMLLPSGNNMARSLAEWAFGSLDNYTKFANSYVKTLGMSQTNLADASGFSPQTVSTATDLTALALRVMDTPVLVDIVGETEATVPVAGTIRNTNFLLGTDGIIGIKTGNTDQAGGCFLFAAKHDVLGQSLVVVGAVMNSPSLNEAMHNAQALVQASDNGFGLASAVQSGQTLGNYTAKWGAGPTVIAQTGLPLLIWRGQPVNVTTHLGKLSANAPAHSPAGTITAQSGSRSIAAPVITSSAVAKPSLSWRLTHP